MDVQGNEDNEGDTFMWNRMIVRKCAVILALASLLGCPKEEEDPLDLTGLWAGTIDSEQRGHGAMEAHLVQTGSELNGTWSSDLSGSTYDMSGSLTGTIDGADLFLDLTPSEARYCGMSATGQVRDGILTLEFVTVDCSETVTGTVVMERQSEDGAAGGSDIAYWEQAFGGSEEDSANAVVATRDGGYAVAGYTESFGAYRKDMYLIKTDAEGAELWRGIYGEEADDWVGALLETSDNGFLLAGGGGQVMDGYDCAYLVRINGGGEIVWTRIIASEADRDVSAYGACHGNDGGYIIAGENGLLMRINDNGEEVWRQEDEGLYYSDVVAVDGGYVLAASSGVRKVDNTGGIVWTTELDRAQSAVIVAPDGGLISQSEYEITKLDRNGYKIWARAYNRIRCIAGTAGEGYVLAGGLGEDNQEAVVLTDSQGYELNVWNLDSTFDEVNRSLHAIASAGGNDYVLAGSIRGDDSQGHDMYLVKVRVE